MSVYKVHIPSKRRQDLAAGVIWLRETDFPKLKVGDELDVGRKSSPRTVRQVDVFTDLSPVGSGRHRDDRYLRVDI